MLQAPFLPIFNSALASMGVLVSRAALSAAFEWNRRVNGSRQWDQRNGTSHPGTQNQMMTLPQMSRFMSLPQWLVRSQQLHQGY